MDITHRKAPPPSAAAVPKQNSESRSDLLNSDSKHLAEAENLTAEDGDQSIDRTRVLNARRGRKPGMVAWLLMGPDVNSRTTNFLGVLITALVTAAGSAYAVVAFMQTFQIKTHSKRSYPEDEPEITDSPR